MHPQEVENKGLMFKDATLNKKLKEARKHWSVPKKKQEKKVLKTQLERLVYARGLFMDKEAKMFAEMENT